MLPLVTHQSIIDASALDYKLMMMVLPFSTGFHKSSFFLPVSQPTY